MTLQAFPLGPLETNCYLLSDGVHAVIIDPAAKAEFLLRTLAEQKLTLDAIFLTHVHFDHIGALRALKEATGAPVYLHPADLSIAGAMARGNLTETLPYSQEMTVGAMRFRVLHTPGHSPGSVCLLIGDMLFSGDTLFAGTCGRTDLSGGSWNDLRASLRLLASLPGDPAVYPGHGAATSLEAERRTNPYLQEATS